MKRPTLALVVSMILLTVPAASIHSGDSRTLTGEFVWNEGSSGDLEAVFIPAGQGKWDVEFHFSFRGMPHVFSGAAEGSLSNGKLAGKVRNESKQRTFTFRRSFEDGTFSGTHAEIGGSRTEATGTLTLSE